MEKVTVPVELPKEFHELMMGLANLALELAVPLSDGLDLEDIDDVVGLLPDIWIALQGIQGVLPEIKGDPGGAAMSGVLVSKMLVEQWPDINGDDK